MLKSRTSFPTRTNPDAGTDLQRPAHARRLRRPAVRPRRRRDLHAHADRGGDLVRVRARPGAHALPGGAPPALAGQTRRLPGEGLVGAGPAQRTA